VLELRAEIETGHILGRLLLAGALFFLAGCATYQSQLSGTKSLIQKNRPTEAAQAIEKKAEAEGDDQVVYLFEYATALQLAKDYKSSNAAFLKAEELTAIKDYHSLSRITGSLLLSEGMVQYKGEDYEKVLINAMLAVNFLMLGDLEAALVETRKLNEKLYKYKFEAKRDYQQNPFAFYLAALIWESNKDWDDAYIDFKKAYDLNPNVAYLKEDLIRAAKAARREDEVKKWQKAFSEVKPGPTKGMGEIVLVYQQGWAPVKRPHPDWPRVPKLYPVSSSTQSARLLIEGVGDETSQVISSVSDVAIKTLDEAYKGLIAKRVAGVAAKAVVSDQIRQKNQLLGDLAWIGMNLADRADLRQWLTLPESFQIAKRRLPPGKYKVTIVGVDKAGAETGERSEEMEVVVKANAKTFLSWRSVK